LTGTTETDGRASIERDVMVTTAGTVAMDSTAEMASIVTVGMTDAIITIGDLQIARVKNYL